MRKYIKELAMTAAELLHKKDVLTAKEIVKANFKGKAVSPAMIRDAERRLTRIKAALEKMYKSPVYLVTQEYFALDKEPTTLAEAKRCVPGVGFASKTGRSGRKGVAIKLHTKGEKDLIWQASMMRNMAIAAGGMKGSFDRTLDAVEGARLGSLRAHHMLLEGVTRARPSNPGALKQLLGSGNDNGNGLGKALSGKKE